MHATHATHGPVATARYRSFHSPKRQVLGTPSGSNHVPPAWRVASHSHSHSYGGTPAGPSSMNGRRPPSHSNLTSGSKILLSQLPADVGEKEVEELFKKTVGPLKESFLVYNSQGKSKGMAVVWFQRTEDAVLAKDKYDGKFVDGRRPIRIEIITDSRVAPGSSSGAGAGAAAATNAKAAPPSLMSRIEGLENIAKLGTTGTGKGGAKHQNHNLPRQEAAVAAMLTSPGTATGGNIPVPPRRRTKKGPKRLKKQFVKVQPPTTTNTKNSKSAPKSKEDLDAEMDDWRANGDGA